MSPMNDPTNDSRSQSQQPNPSATVQSIEISIQKLNRSLYRRQKWHQLFNPTDQLTITNSPWRAHLVKFLESTPVLTIAIFLLVLDLAITTFELSSSLRSCSPRESSNVENVWYHWVGIGILVALSAKTAAMLVGLGGAFFRRPGYVLDGVVLAGALVLEALKKIKGGGLLVVASLWRAVRVVESAFELTDDAIEAQISALVIQFESLREENARLLEAVAEKDELIATLEKQVDQCAGSSHRMNHDHFH